MRQSFYVQVWPRAFDAVSKYIQKYHNRCEETGTYKRFKFFIFDGCLDKAAKTIIPCSNLSSAITTMISIVRDRMRMESFESPLIYHVSIWQLRRDGKFHRVGYAEDEFTHIAINGEVKDENLRNALWRGIDMAVAERVQKEIDNM